MKTKTKSSSTPINNCFYLSFNYLLQVIEDALNHIRGKTAWSHHPLSLHAHVHTHKHWITYKQTFGGIYILTTCNKDNYILARACEFESVLQTERFYIYEMNLHPSSLAYCCFLSIVGSYAPNPQTKNLLLVYQEEMIFF